MTADEQPREQAREQSGRGTTGGKATGGGNGNGGTGAPRRRPSPRPRPHPGNRPSPSQARPASSGSGSAAPSAEREKPQPQPQAGDSAATAAATEAGQAAFAAELQALRSELEERTRDLQRVTAEYANYRKRVDRDRGLVAEQATGSVLAALLPVLDDLDRAREHGDLVGPFGAVAEHLITTLGKFGLTPFGEVGDAFDPTRHEAVAHSLSPEVSEPTCVTVMRRGYMLGDRVLRAALVGVAEPGPEPADKPADTDASSAGSDTSSEAPGGTASAAGDAADASRPAETPQDASPTDAAGGDETSSSGTSGGASSGGGERHDE